MSETTSEDTPTGSGPDEVRFRSFIERVQDRTYDRMSSVATRETAALGLLMRRIANEMTDVADQEILRPAGLTLASFRICFALWVDGPQEPHEVARVARLSRAAVSSSLKGLVAAGFVTTSASERDLRSIVMTLTDTGSAHIESTYAKHLALEEELFAPLSTPERQILLGLLGKLGAGSAAIGDGAASR